MYRNRNVSTVIVASIFNSFAFSILWFSTTWLVYGLGGSNTVLGQILGVTSLLSIFSSFIASYLADRYRKDVIVIIGGIIGLMGIYLLSVSHSLTTVFIGQLLSSIGSGSSHPIVVAILSDSLPSKNRTKVFGTQFLLSESSSAVGSIVGFFVYQGMSSADIGSLNLDLIRLMMSIAFFSYLMVIILYALFLRDKHAIASEEEGSVSNASGDSFVKGALSIVGLSLLSAFIIGFGAGISIPYFPRFFFDIYKIDLASLSLLMSGVSIFTALWGKFTANMAHHVGHIKIIVLNQIVSVTLLYILATYPPIYFALATLIIRNAVMNGVGSVATSVLMEYSPRSYRSKISAINEISWLVFFSLGNIIGGRAVDLYGFRIPIISTATLYLIATILYVQIGRIIKST